MNTETSIKLPETGFLRIKQVLEFIPVCRVTFLNGVKTGRFPIKPIKNGRCTFYKVEEIRAFIESQCK